MIAAEAQHHPARTPAAAYAAAAQALIIRTLLLEEARREGIAVAPQQVGTGKRELDDEAQIRALLDLRVPLSEPDEAQCLRYYDAHPDRFRGADLFEVSHILFPGDPAQRGSIAEAIRRATEAIADINTKPARFETIARELSACPSRENGGRLGQMTANDLLPEFAAALPRLRVGETASDPVVSRFGAHVVRLDARADGARLPFTYVRERIVAYLAERDWRGAVVSFIEALLARNEIEGVEMHPALDGA